MTKISLIFVPLGWLGYNRRKYTYFWPIMSARVNIGPFYSRKLKFLGFKRVQEAWELFVWNSTFWWKTNFGGVLFCNHCREVDVIRNVLLFVHLLLFQGRASSSTPPLVLVVWHFSSNKEMRDSKRDVADCRWPKLKIIGPISLKI